MGGWVYAGTESPEEESERGIRRRVVFVRPLALVTVGEEGVESGCPWPRFLCGCVFVFVCCVLILVCACLR